MNGPSPESLCVQYAPGEVREAIRPLLSVISLEFKVASIVGEPYWGDFCIGAAVEPKQRQTNAKVQRRKEKHKTSLRFLFARLRLRGRNISANS